MYEKCINKGMGKLGNWEMEGGSEALPAESRWNNNKWESFVSIRSRIKFS